MALLAIPLLYLVAALIGSLIPVNRAWSEPADGTTVYLADNGIHTDIVMPVRAQGLDWRPLLPARDFAAADPMRELDRVRRRRAARLSRHADLVGHHAAHLVVGARPAASGVMHVEYVPSPAYAVRANPAAARGISPPVGGDPRRLRARRARRPQRIDHPGYGPSDAFYRATGKASALKTCNTWVAGRLRLAGIKTSLWPPMFRHSAGEPSQLVGDIAQDLVPLHHSLFGDAPPRSARGGSRARSG